MNSLWNFKWVACPQLPGHPHFWIFSGPEGLKTDRLHSPYEIRSDPDFLNSNLEFRLWPECNRSVIKAAGLPLVTGLWDQASGSDALSGDKFLRIQSFKSTIEGPRVAQFWQKQKISGGLSMRRQWKKHCSSCGLLLEQFYDVYQKGADGVFIYQVPP